MTTIALHKPYGVLSRFTSDGSKHATLASIEPKLPKDVWPIGRLDADSEGLLVLSSDKRLVDALLAPAAKTPKTYWAQVERVPADEALAHLRAGVLVDGVMTLPAKARVIESPSLQDRTPPIRFRKTVPTAWIELVIVEGRNRQVRKMTAAVGHPTLRLVRVQIGALRLDPMAQAAGAWRVLDDAGVAQLQRGGRGGPPPA